MIYKNQKLDSVLFNTEDFQELPSCGIEDVDRATFQLFDKVLPIFYSENGTNKRYPVIYATGERAVILKKRQPLRDQSGALILPLISIMRTGIEQDPQDFGIVPSQEDIIIKKRIYKNNQDYKRSINENNFRNQQNVLTSSTLHGGNTSRLWRWGDRITGIQEKSTNNIYETFTMPAPRFFKCSYEITFWCQYQQQLNDVYEAIMSSYNHAERSFRLESDKGYYFTAFFERNFAQNNNYDSMLDQERIVKATMTMSVNGYVINSNYPGSIPVVKRHVSSPRIVFESLIGEVPTTRATTPGISGKAEDYTNQDFDHEFAALPGSSTSTYRESKNLDILIGKSGKLVNPDLIIEETNSTTGKVTVKKYVIKDKNHRKGESVLREVLTLS